MQHTGNFAAHKDSCNTRGRSQRTAMHKATLQEPLTPAAALQSFRASVSPSPGPVGLLGPVRRCGSSAGGFVFSAWRAARGSAGGPLLTRCDKVRPRLQKERKKREKKKEKQSKFLGKSKRNARRASARPCIQTSVLISSSGEEETILRIHQQLHLVARNPSASPPLGDEGLMCLSFPTLCVHGKGLNLHR